MSRLAGVVTAAALLLAAACSAGEVRPSGTATVGVSSTSVPSETSVGTLVVPSESPTPSTTPAPNAEELANAAASKLLNDLNTSRCATPAPQCNVVSIGDPPAGNSFERGLAYYNIKSTRDVDRVMVLGRTQAGAWFLYLWGERFYNVSQLPSAATVCGFGSGATAHAAANASSDSVGTLDEGASVIAEQFVLTAQGKLPTAQPFADQGYGWYRIAEPAGWVYSKYLAQGSDCALHDQLEPR
jgi:hypothetical protein